LKTEEVSDEENKEPQTGRIGEKNEENRCRDTIFP